MYAFAPCVTHMAGDQIELQHYKDNTWVAGYNPLNEPADIQHIRLMAFYERLEKAVRAVDPHHILFLECVSIYPA